MIDGIIMGWATMKQVAVTPLHTIGIGVHYCWVVSRVTTHIKSLSYHVIIIIC